MDNSQMELSDLMSQLGEFGPYQFRQHCLHSLAWLLTGLHLMSFIFIFPELEHRCYVEDIDGHNATESFSDIGKYIPKNAEGKLESCLKYTEFSNSLTISCNGSYIYNSSYFRSSRVTDWDLVCDKGWMRACLQSTFLIGTLFGALISGVLSDKFGRKPIFCLCGFLQGACGIIGVFMDNYIAFAISMFWFGLFGASGATVPAVGLTMEIVGASKRNFCGTMFTVWFGIGSLILVGWAYFLPASILSAARNLQFIYALHSILLFFHWWIMDESICWLWTNGKKKEAIRIAKKAAKCNGKEFIDRYSVTQPDPATIHNSQVNNHSSNPPSKEKSSKNPSALELFKYPKLRQRTLVMLYCWFAASLTYFGLSFNSVNLFGNPYLMFVIITLMEVPAHFISFFLTPVTGNKPLLVLSMFMAGVACVAIAVLPLDIISTLITMWAKVFATISFNIINSYTAELFPTSLRNTAIGLCFMAARTGASIMPEINLLSAVAQGIPSITFGLSGILASIFILFLLPETMHRQIPQTIEDVENSQEVDKDKSGITSICS